MTRGTRSVVAVIGGFVLYRILVEFMQLWPALLLGALAGLAVYLLTAPLSKPAGD